MAAKTRFGLDGYGVRRAGSFASKTGTTAGTPPESAGVKRSGFLKGVGRMLPRCIILFALLLT